MMRSRDTELNQGFPSFAFGRTRRPTIARVHAFHSHDQTEPASLVAVGFGRDGAVQEMFESRWGAPTIVEVTRRNSERWIGQFAAGGLGGVSGLYAVPNSLQLCVVADGLAYLVDVDSDPPAAQVVHDQVGQVEAAAEPDLLLLVRFIDIVAVGPAGVAWRTPRLAVDDLHVLTTTDGQIVCALDNLGHSSTITLDAATGVQLTGTRLDSFWPLDALA